MTQDEREAKSGQMMEKFEDKLRTFNATPILLLGVSHAPAKTKGKFIICVPDGMSVTEVHAIVAEWMKELSRVVAGE